MKRLVTLMSILLIGAAQVQAMGISCNVKNKAGNLDMRQSMWLDTFNNLLSFRVEINGQEVKENNLEVLMPATSKAINLGDPRGYTTVTFRTENPKIHFEHNGRNLISYLVLDSHRIPMSCK